MAGKKELAAANKTEVGFVDEKPAHVSDTNRGNEGVGVEDMVIPRIQMVQDLSPQRKKSEPEYIEGAEEGMVFNTVTNQLYGDSVTIIPVLFRKEWVIWKDRKEGGGFKGSYPNPDAADKALKELEDGDKCEIVDSAQHFCIVVNGDGDTEEAVVSMSKSQMKPSRQLNSLINGEGGDRWARGYRLNASTATNSANQSYFNWTIKQLGYTPEGLAEQALAMYEAVSAGVRDVAWDDDHETLNPTEGEAEPY